MIKIVIILALVLAILGIAIACSQGDFMTVLIALPALVIAAFMLKKNKIRKHQIKRVANK